MAHLDSESAGYETWYDVNVDLCGTRENETVSNDMIFESDLDVNETASESEDDICDASEKQAVDVTCDCKPELKLCETANRISGHERAYPLLSLRKA